MSRRNLALTVLGVFVVSLGVYFYALYNYNKPKSFLTRSNQESGTASMDKAMFGLATAYDSDMAPAKSATQVANQVFTPDRMVIRSGDIASVVDDVRLAIGSVSEFVAKEKGYVVSSYISKNQDKPYGTVVVRVPAATFDNAFAVVRALGEVQSENVNGQDITEEFVDLESQVRNLRATETQLLELMRRSGTVGDILNVQRELTNVRSQIERLEGRMKYLKESAAMSTLSVHFSTDPENLPVFNDDGKTWKPVAVFKEAIRGLVEVLMSVGNFLIYFVVFIPVWLVVGLVVWAAHKVFIHFKNRS